MCTKISDAIIGFNIQGAKDLIKSIADLMVQVSPSKYLFMYNLTDIDIVNDNIYDEFELFRDSANELLILESKFKAQSLNQNLQNVSQNVFQNIENEESSISKIGGQYISKLVFASGESIGLGRVAMGLQKFNNTTAILSFIQDFAETFHTLEEYGTTNEKKLLSHTSTIRKLNRKLSKQYDVFINFIENPTGISTPTEEFEQLKLAIYEALAPICEEIARIATYSSYALVPEMYFDQRAGCIKRLKDYIPKFNESIQNLRKKAVGPTADDLPESVSTLPQIIEEFEQISSHLDFDAEFPSFEIVKSVSKFSTMIDKLMKTMPTIVDKVQIDPDPISASRVPTSFELPPLQTSQQDILPPQEALENLQAEHEKFEAVLKDIQTTHDEEYASSLDLVDSSEKLNNAAKAFSVAINAMIVATTDPRTQVESQTAAHAFSASIVQAFTAIKNRLMRTPDFKKDFSQALLEIRKSICRLLELGESASTVTEVAAEVVDEEVDSDSD